MARYLNLGLQTTQTRLKAAKDSILTLVAKCEQYRGDIVATTSKPTKLNPRTVTGWKGGWLGPMKAEALISPHLVQFPDVEGQPPVRAQPLNIKTLKAKLRGVKPIFSPHRWVIDGNLFFPGPVVTGGGSCDTDQTSDVRSWRGALPPAVDADASDSESDGGSDDGVSAEGTSTDFLKLSSATKAQMTNFAVSFDLATTPAQIKAMTADVLRSYVRPHCFLRVDTASDGARASDAAGAGADGEEDIGRAPNVLKRTYVPVNFADIDLDRDGPDSDVIAAKLFRLRVEPPSFRYGPEPGKIDLCGAPDPSDLISFCLGSGPDGLARTWTPELWSAAVNNLAKSTPPDATSSSAFPLLKLSYGYDLERIRLRFTEIQESTRRLSMPRVYIKSDKTRRGIVESELKSFFQDDDRVRTEATEVLFRRLAVAMDLEGKEASIRSYLRNNGFFSLRTKRRKELLQAVPADEGHGMNAQHQPRVLEGGRHVPGSQVALSTLRSQVAPNTIPTGAKTSAPV